MKIRKPQYGRYFLLGSLAAFAYQNLMSQTTDADDDVYVLSPFVVDASEDVGYYASQTLAGGRVATNIIDTGTSIEVLTKEFLEDIGGNNIEEILQYTTNAQVGGINGNYVGASPVSAESGNVSSQGARRDPSGTASIRGLGRPDRTRNYYKSAIPLDAYNTERFDINRGSNSFLFGLGSPAGLYNSGLAKAQFNDMNEVTFRVGSGGDRPSYRIEGDFNRVVIDDMLAVRVAALHDRKQYRQKPTFRDDDRIYTSVTFKPFQNTIIRAYLEDGEISGNAPDTLLPQHAFDTFIRFRNPIDVYYNMTHFGNIVGPTYEQWLELPESEQSKFSWREGPDPSGGNEKVNLGGEAIGSLWVPGFNIIYDGQTSDGSPSMGYMQVWANNLWAEGNPFWDPAVLPDGSPGGNSGGAPAMVYYKNSRYTAERGIEGPATGFMTLDGYDFSKNNFAGNADYYGHDFNNYNFSLEQMFWDGKVGFELGYDHQKVTKVANTNFNAGRGGEFMIDVNKTLLLPSLDSNGNPLEDENGQIVPKALPNPNFGRPFFMSATGSSESVTELKTYRATAYFKHNFQDSHSNSWLKWLGSHHLTALFDKHTDHYHTYDKELRGHSLDFDAKHHAGYNGTHSSKKMVYLGPAIQSYINDPFSLSTPLDVTDIRIETNPYDLREDYIEVPVYFWNKGSLLPGKKAKTPNGDEYWDRGTMGYGWEPRWRNTSRYTETKSWAVNSQSRFFKDHLVFNVGYREDVVRNWLNQKPAFDKEKDQYTNDPSEFNPWKGRFTKIDKGPDGSGSFGYGGVWHLPVDMLNIPDFVKPTIHYNYSKNFVPLADRVGINTTSWKTAPMPSPTGESKDYGVTLRFWENKLVLRLNWYESNILNSSNGLGSLLNKFSTNMFKTYSAARRIMLENDTDRDGVWDEDKMTDFHLKQFDYDKAVALYNDLRPVIEDTWLKVWLDEERIFYQDKANFPDEDFSLEDGVLATKQPRHIQWIGGLQDSQDVTSEGFEMNVIYNPTKSWRIAFNLSKTETVYSRIGATMSRFIDDIGPVYAKYQNYDFWNPHRINPRGTLKKQVGGLFEQYYKSKLQEGSPVNEVRKWRFGLTTNYLFRSGIFKGFDIGGSIRWQEAGVLGYPFANHTLIEATDTIPATTVRVPDISKPYHGKDNVYADLKFGYRRKIFDNKIDWRIYFHVKNLQNIESDKLSVFTKDQFGNAQRMRFDPPLQFSLTSKFSF